MTSRFKWEPGQVVAYYPATLGRATSLVRKTITRVTPTGIAVIESPPRDDGYKAREQFDDWGRQKTTDRYHHAHIEPWTKEHDIKLALQARNRVKRYLTPVNAELERVSLDYLIEVITEMRAEAAKKENAG